MLDQRQQEYVTENIYISDHDYFYWSSLLGEPFLENDILHFFDGETITFIGYPINIELQKESVFQTLNNLVKMWIKNPSVRFLNYLGPWEYDFSELLGDRFINIYMEKPDYNNVHMLVDLSDPTVLKTRNAVDSIRKIRNKGIKVWIGRRTFLEYEHINLIREIALRDSVELSDVSFLSNIYSIIRSDDTLFFEVKYYQKLEGFAVVHEFFCQKPFLVLAFFNIHFKGTSDAIYSTIIQYYLEKGAKQISLGYSLNPRLHKYKSKWGGIRSNLPFYQSLWLRKDTSSDSSDCLHWICRLLITKSKFIPITSSVSSEVRSSIHILT